MDRRIAPSARIEEAIERVLLDELDDPDALSRLGRLGAQLIFHRRSRASWSFLGVLATPGRPAT